MACAFTLYRYNILGMKSNKHFTCQHIRSQCTLSLHPENIRKPLGFLKFSGGRERVHWEQMG